MRDRIHDLRKVNYNKYNYSKAIKFKNDDNTDNNIKKEQIIN